MAENNQLEIVKNSIEIFKTAPEVLIAHQTRSAKALELADAIIVQWNEAYAIADPEAKFAALAAVDERSNRFLVKCNAASEEMVQARSAITQLMDMLRSMYTKEENSLDPKKGAKPIEIQGQRNKYATVALQEAERKRKVAADKAAKDKEEVDIRTYISSTISQKLIDHLAGRKLKITEGFNKITLETFEEKSKGLQAVNPAFPIDKQSEIIAYHLPKVYRHSDAEVEAIKNAEYENYDFKSFQLKHHNEIKEFIQSLVDRLPSKKAELDEQKRIADEAETQRLAEVERQRLAEVERQKQITLTNNQKEKDRLIKQAAEDRQKEADRLKEIEKNAELEKQNLLTAQTKREEEQNQQIATQAETAKVELDEKTEMQRTAGHSMALFNEVTETASAAVTPEVREGIKVNVLHIAGWVELFQFWFSRVGVHATADDFESMTFKKLKAYAEKMAKETGKTKPVLIESKNIGYEGVVTSVNRKVKTT